MELKDLFASCTCCNWSTNGNLVIVSDKTFYFRIGYDLSTYPNWLIVYGGEILAKSLLHHYHFGGENDSTYPHSSFYISQIGNSLGYLNVTTGVEYSHFDVTNKTLLAQIHRSIK